MLRGTLDDFSLPDIFRLMSFAKRTGSLQVERSAGQGTVYFRNGDVYFAQSSLSREPLGEKLVKMKAITQGQLRKALDQHKTEGKRLGEVLLETQMVDEDQIMAAVREQIADAAFDLLRWELGEFVWEPNVEFDAEVEIYVSVENLIMEASRRLEELEVIQRKIPSVETVLAMAPKPPEGAVEINITPEEWRMLVLVNGQRSVREIAEFTGGDEFETMKALYGLVSAGLIEVPGHADEFEEVVEEAPAARVEADAPSEPTEETAPEAASEPVLEAQPEIQAEAIEAPLADQPVGVGPMVEPEEQPAEDIAEPVAEAPAPEETAASAAEPVTAEASPEEWTEVHGASAPVDEVPVESFDAPAPGDLTAAGPLADPFADEILAPEPAFPALDKTSENGQPEPVAAAPEAPAAPEAEAPSEPAPPAPEPVAEAETQEAPEEPSAQTEQIPVTSAQGGEAPAVDRIAAVRELAGLFNEESEEGESAPRRPVTAGAPDQRKRVEDDEQVTRGLISRLIDGVKGL